MSYELHLSNFISDQDITEFTAKFFSVKAENILVCDSIEELDDHDICIVKTLRDGDFPYTLQFYMPPEIGQCHEEELAVTVCEKFKLSCLVTDDTINPYAWLKIDEYRGYTEVFVNVDALDEQGIFIIDSQIRG